MGLSEGAGPVTVVAARCCLDVLHEGGVLLEEGWGYFG